MAPEIKKAPVVAETEKLSNDSNERYRPKIEANADYRAGFTRRSFEATEKSLTDFLAEIKKPPYNIDIDEKDDKSLAYGIFCFQRLLGPPEVENDFLHDGMCGPATLRKFNEVKLKNDDAQKLRTLSSTVVKVPPASESKVPPQAKTKFHETNETQLTEVHIGKTMNIGDSLTYGMQTYGGLTGDVVPPHTYTTVIKKGVEKKREHGLAVTGQQTSAMHESFAQSIDDGYTQKIKRANFFGGVNDLAAGQSVETVKNNLLQMYTLAAEHNIEITACTLTPWDTEKVASRPGYALSAQELNKRTTELNEWIRTKAKSELLAQNPQASFTVIDLFSEVSSHPKKYPQIKDGLHFTKAGYIALADFVTAQAHISRDTLVS